MSTFRNVVVRVGGLDKTTSRYPVEAQIDGSGLWKGYSDLDFGALGNLSKQDYGAALAKQLLNANVARALEQAGVGKGEPVRIRLLVEGEDSAPHWIRWERMALRVGAADWPIAIAPNTPFSRYIPDERPDADPPGDNIFRLLLAISNPADLPETQRLDVDAEVRTLLKEFRNTVPSARFRVRVMGGRSGLSAELQTGLKEAGWDVADGHTSLDNVSDYLHRDGGCHALHIICHGNFKPPAGPGLLFLEDASGNTETVKDFDLQSWLQPKLQLIVFQACKTAAAVPEGEPPFAGIAPQVVRNGVPAVIAMQDFILMSDARAFSAAFYRTLLQDGLVDVAVNAGRRAIPHAVERVDSTIPALFMRLKEGRLWRPDPVRRDVWDTRDRLGKQPESLPLKVVQHSRGLDYDPSQSPDGPLFDLKTRLDELVDQNWFTCLTGPPGFDKTAQMYRQFERLADLYLTGQSDVAPFLLGLSDLSQWGRFQSGATPGDLRGNMQAVAGRRVVPPELKDRAFVFLVQADQDLSQEAGNLAVDTLLHLLRSFPGSRALVIYDETALSDLRQQLDADQSTPESERGVRVLVVRPLEWSAVKRHLLAYKTSEETRLAEVIEECQLSDIASAPWILARLLGLAQRQRFPINRADALGLIASTYLVNFDSRRAPRSCAEQALERIAWHLQTDRTTTLDNDTLVAILADVRDRRDFTLSALADELIRCQILASAGDDGVRFGYRLLQAYFAARYIQKSPRRMHLLEDITATLGRYSRMRHWEDVLIALAGIQTNAAERIGMLQALVAGSSFAEGEQALLAARMHMEMIDRRRDVASREYVREVDPSVSKDKVVRQIVDTLIWRSRPDIPRPYADRKHAVRRLGEMRHPDAIQHLIALAVDRFVPPGEAADGAERKKRFDNAGIRRLAVRGLFLQYKVTEEYVRRKRTKLVPLIDAWRAMADGSLAPIVEILNRNDDPCWAPVAAFALGEAGMEAAGPPLLEVFTRAGDPNPERRPHDETLWAITEVFGRQDARWLRQTVIDPWLAAHPEPNKRICYLIQMSAEAAEGSSIRNYLYRCLEEPEAHVHDRALRALSKLNDPRINAWLAELCQHIVTGNWEAVLASPQIKLQRAPEGPKALTMQQAALEVLRDVGDEHSMNVIRDARLSLDPVLYQLSFQVSEQLYWKLSGGMTKENFGTASDAARGRR